MIFLITWWKEILFAALIAALSFQTHRLSNVEAEIVEANTRYHQAIDAAKAETKKAEKQSEVVKNEINASIPKLVESAKANAVELYKRRYQRVKGVNATANLGSGIGGGNTPNVGVFNAGSDTTRTASPNSAESTAKESVGLDAGCAAGFINEAAEAAVIIDGWLTWARANQLPFEK
jgi:hypothetical protein